MSVHCNPSDLAMEAFFEMELEVDAENDLYDEHEHQAIGEGGVDILCEGSAFVQMSQEVCHDRNGCAEDLQGYVPSISNDLATGVSSAVE
jgi:hypothetical protein